MARKDISWRRKLAILKETSEAGATVVGVARRHNLQPQTLRRWRRELNAMSPEEQRRIASSPQTTARQSRAEWDAYQLSIKGKAFLCEDAATSAYSALPAPEFAPGEATDDYAPSDPGIDYFLGERDHFLIEIHGKLPRGSFSMLPLALPNDLRRQLEQYTRGSKSQAILGLVRYALDTLHSKGKALHIYNEADGIPLPPRRTPQKERPPSGLLASLRKKARDQGQI